MARVPKRQSLQRTILDRLVDDDPASSGLSDQHVKGLKESVRRDLENLLNTRRRSVGWSPDLTELDNSLANYGIPDFTVEENVGRFINEIQGAIRRFEPRFKSVKVTLLDNKDEEDRVLRFRIAGMLHAEPAPEPTVFTTEMEPTTGTFEVKGGSE